MRDYGQIQCSFWSHPDTRSVSIEARLIACYLLTGPHSNGIGCYWLPQGYIEADLGMVSETISKAFNELVNNGFVKRCESTNFVLIPAYLKWNKIANPNVAKARAEEFDRVPKAATFYGELALYLNRYGKHWEDPFKTVIETLSNRYIEQKPIPAHPSKEEASQEGDIPPLRVHAHVSASVHAREGVTHG